ncbi:MAG TPA: hypothetical protein VKA38_07225 [Draconibacterium sp.]|nr:hypothetical protein [Draconibacterium sp.]
MKKTITCLITATTLILISFGAMAQGGLTPIVGSAHNYTVTPGNVANTFAWSVIEGTAGSEYTINSGAAGVTVNITWNTAGTYTLQFRETNATSCVTLKQVSVIVAANTFDVSTNDPAATCNSKDGTVNPTGNATTSITFTVDMTTSRTDWSPNWEITFTLTPSGTSSVANVAASAGTLSGSGPYTITGLTSASGNGTVNITMDVTEDAFTLQTTVLTITSATALDYNLSDIDTDDWLATQTINAIPNTSTITTD